MGFSFKINKVRPWSGFQLKSWVPDGLDMEILGPKDGIMVFKNFLSRDECEQLVKLFDQDPSKHAGFGLKANGNLEITPDKITTELDIPKTGSWKALSEKITVQMLEAVKQYASHSPGLQVKPLKWANYKIKMYEKGKGLFKWHFDALGSGAWERQIAVIIYLNSVSEGGETMFFHQKLNVKPEAGMALLFPPFWTHLHSGNTPVSENKYVITTFVSFELA